MPPAASHATAAPGSGAKNPNSDATVTTGLDSTSAVVGLSLAPLATDAKLAPAKGKKVDFNSSAAKSERAKLVAQRNAFKKWLQSQRPQGAGHRRVRRRGERRGRPAQRHRPRARCAAAPGVTSVGYQGTYRPDGVGDARRPRSRTPTWR